MKIEEVGLYINKIAIEGLTEDCVFDYFEPLAQAISSDEEIAKKFASLSNTHEMYLNLIQKNEDALELITRCLEWPSCGSILAYSQLSDIRRLTVKENKLIGMHLMNDPDPTVRAECARQWSVCAEKLINDPHELVRSVCAGIKETFALHLINDPHGMVRVACTKWRSCAERYVYDENISVRTRAVHNHPEIAELFLNDPSAEVRKYCVKASEFCARKLINDPDWTVRITILHTLNDLASYFQNDQCESVRQAADNYLKCGNRQKVNLVSYGIY